MIFLMEYDSGRNQILSLQRFGDDERELASQTRLRRELESMPHPVGWEIVLLEASSEEELRRTHGRYFGEHVGSAA